jgi:hypothetical protein
MPYADPLKRAECAREACRRYYLKYHAKELRRAARYRQSNRKAVARRQRQFTKRKLAQDPTYRMKIRLQVDWARRCKRKRVYHSKGFLQLLGCSWSEFTARVERQFKRRGWDWSDYGSEFTIDHRLPCCAFDLRKAEQRAMCSHFSNLQVLSVEQNRRKNGSYSKVELRCFKTLWRSRYGRKCRQLRLFKEQRCECPF